MRIQEKSIIDCCPVCLEQGYQWQWQGRWLTWIFPNSPRSPYKHSCGKIFHLRCAKIWFSSENENRKDCMMCRQLVTDLKTFRESYQETLKKISAWALLVFGLLLGGIIANIMFSGNILMAVAGMCVGWKMMKRLFETPSFIKGCAPLQISFDWFYCFYHGIEIKQIKIGL